jgi:hypothetical protein
MKNIQFAAMLLLTIIASCKKDDQLGPNDPTVPKKLVSISYADNKYLPTQISYDSKGRVVKMDDGEDVSTLSYTGNEVHIVEFRKAENREVFNFKGKLNSKGWLTEGGGTASYSGTVRQEKYNMEYDADGRMTRRIMDFNNGETVYEYRFSYKNGNLASQEVYINGVYDYGGVWEYDLNTKDQSGLNWNQFGPGNNFTGQTNKNLAIKYTGYRDGKISWYADYVYTFDAAAYPITNAVNISTGNTYTLVYEFK